MKSEIEDKIIKKMDESIEEVLEGDFTVGDVDTLYKLVKTKHIAKEDKEMMNYGNYYNGRGPSRGAYGEYNRGYGEYNDYGRRGRDSRYRGYGHMDRMYNEYGRYEESRERYGANEDTMKSLKYMLESMEDFARMLREEAQSQEEVEMIRQTAQRIAQM